MYLVAYAVYTNVESVWCNSGSGFKTFVCLQLCVKSRDAFIMLTLDLLSRRPSKKLS